MSKSIKFDNDNYMDATGIRDSTLNKTQREINGSFYAVTIPTIASGTARNVVIQTIGEYLRDNVIDISGIGLSRPIIYGGLVSNSYYFTGTAYGAGTYFAYTYQDYATAYRCRCSNGSISFTQLSDT